ncbi:Inactive protein RESTRICTED TEV MOVEMENT 2 [Morella rubra]|uniref:Inactive protein RESTRICTED TEV MOVEMENT 2 n=1 Tax=Morella rubra TaxID=262757 RepID=A0A6A1WNQ2_9ROSI|nr:Inactive protein RESTRICTED TEV MOVEMENT 2 [Morella rubra]
MDGVQRVLDPVYETFDPQTEWQLEEGFDTLIVHLSAFRKDQIRVQVAATRKLRITGERPLGNNKWRRFHKEFPIPQNVDVDQIVAKYEGGVLYVKCPKVITPAPESRKAPTEVSKPQQKPRLSEPQQAAQRIADQKQVAQEVPPKADGDKQTTGKTAAPANAYNAAQKTPKSGEKEAGETSGKSSAVADAKMALQKTPDQKEKEPIRDANNLSQKIASDKERSELETRQKPWSSTGDKKHESPGGSVNDAAQMDKGSASGTDKSRLVGYKELVGGLAREMRKAKKVTNLVVAALLVLVRAEFSVGATVIKNHEGQIVGNCVERFSIEDPEEGEIRKAQLGLAEAGRCGLNQITVEGDSLLAIEAFRHFLDKWNWKYHVGIGDISRMASTFESCSFSFVHHGANEVAHLLVQWAVSVFMTEGHPDIEYIALKLRRRI